MVQMLGYLPQVRAPELPDVGNALNKLGESVRYYRSESDKAQAYADAQEQKRYSRGRAAAGDAAALEEKANQAAARVGQAIMGLPENQQAAAWQKTLSLNPKMSQTLGQYGVDPNDHRAGAQFFVGLTQPVRDPLEVEKTRAQIDDSKASAASNYADVDYKKAQAADLASKTQVGGGYKDLAQKAGVEEGLRKEFVGNNKDYAIIRDSAAKVEALAKNASAASDIGLIYSIMKMFDPGSVVRETEYATAQNAAGVPDQLRNVWNRVKDGVRLNDAQRQDFVNQARSIAKTQRDQYERGRSQYEGIAKRLNVDPRNVLPDYEHGEARRQAAEAMQRGAPRDAVIQRLLEAGVDPTGL